METEPAQLLLTIIGCLERRAKGKFMPAIPKKKKIPGSIYTRSGKNTIYLKFKGTEYSTGLVDTPLNRKIAENRLESLYTSWLTNKGLSPSNRTMNDLWKEFYAERSLRASKRTMTLYARAYEKLRMAIVKPKKTDIEEHLLQWVNDELRRGKLHRRTININLDLITPFLSWLAEKSVISKVKTAKFKLSAGTKEYMNYSDDEFARLVEYFRARDNVQFANLLMFIRLTGARQNEAFTLRWEQVDFANEKIIFPVKTKQMDKDDFPIYSALRELLEEQKKLSTGETVFSFKWQYLKSKSSRPTIILNRAQKALGIYRRGRSYHSIRKTFANALFEANKGLDKVQKLMRHKDIKTTMKYYSGYEVKELGKEMEAMPPVNVHFMSTKTQNDNTQNQAFSSV